MGRTVKVLGIGAVLLALAWGTAGAQERKIQIAAIAAGFAGGESDGPAAGAGIRVDLHLSKTFMISPEAVCLFSGSKGPWLGSLTLSYFFGKAFAGIGYALVADFDPPAAYKLQAGYESRHLTLAGSLYMGGGPALFGLAVGYIF